MKTILDFINTHLNRVNAYLSGFMDSVLTLASTTAQTGIRVFLCVTLYKIAFEDFLLNIF